MYKKEQIIAALKCYEEEGQSIHRTIRKLGYPEERALKKWIKRPVPEGPIKSRNRVHYSYEEKLTALKRCFELGESPKKVAEEMGLSASCVIFNWYRRHLVEGKIMPMVKREIKKTHQPKPPPDELSELKKENERLQMEVDILKETLNVLKKDPGVDPKELVNREKVVIVDALRNRYSLPKLLSSLNLVRSSYYDARQALARPDKYAELRQVLRDLFENNYGCFGYRRIDRMLRNQNYYVSEKVIRRLMREENLIVRRKKKSQFKSYLGEISPAVPNLLERNFHAAEPNEKWLTDITEFSIPAGKVYLSPIVDCFDGMLVAWNMDQSPNAELADQALRDALKTLDGRKPIVHSDRGSHYRWPDWIKLMNENGLTRSMSKKGCSPDNAACEGFFGRMKNECFYGRKFLGVSIADFMDYLDNYLNWYNEKRIKLSLGGLSPAQYRQSLIAT